LQAPGPGDRGDVGVGVALDLVLGVFGEGCEQLDLGPAVVELELLARIDLEIAVVAGGLDPGTLDVVDRALLADDAARVRQRQLLRLALVARVLRALEGAHERIAVAVLVDEGREHLEGGDVVAVLVKERRDALIQKHVGAIERPAPAALVLVPVLDDAKPLRGRDDPLDLAVGVGGEIAVAGKQPCELVGLLGENLFRSPEIEPFCDALVADILQVDAVGLRVVEIFIADHPVQANVGIALVALLQHQLHAADAVDPGLQQGPVIERVLELAAVQHRSHGFGCDLGAGLALRVVAFRLGVAAHPLDHTDDGIDLAADLVPDLHRLVAGFQNPQLLGGELRAVIVAP
jgi:hypothetical protein